MSSAMKDKVFLITGCSSGFGFELARQALAAGAKVAATSRDVARLEPLIQEFPNTVQPLGARSGKPGADR